MTHRNRLSNHGLKQSSKTSKKNADNSIHQKNVPSFGIEQKTERNKSTRENQPNHSILQNAAERAFRRNSAYKNVAENDVKFFEGNRQ